MDTRSEILREKNGSRKTPITRHPTGAERGKKKRRGKNSVHDSIPAFRRVHQCFILFGPTILLRRRDPIGLEKKRKKAPKNTNLLTQPTLHEKKKSFGKKGLNTIKTMCIAEPYKFLVSRTDDFKGVKDRYESNVSKIEGISSLIRPS